MSEDKKLISKLVRVMSNVKRVSKNGTNTFQNYDYVTEADILNAVRDNLAKENVFIFSSVDGSHKEGNLTSVMMRHTFVDGDTGEIFEVKSLGQGSDNQDKGSNKAITGAIKYMLLKNFLMPTGDDPEATDETGKSTSAKVIKSEPKKFGFSNRPKSTPALAKVEVTEVSDEF